MSCSFMSCRGSSQVQSLPNCRSRRYRRQRDGSSDIFHASCSASALALLVTYLFAWLLGGSKTLNVCHCWNILALLLISIGHISYGSRHQQGPAVTRSTWPSGLYLLWLFRWRKLCWLAHHRAQQVALLILRLYSRQSDSHRKYRPSCKCQGPFFQQQSGTVPPA